MTQIQFNLMNLPFAEQLTSKQIISDELFDSKDMKTVGGKVYEEWLDEAKNLFKKFVHNLEKAIF